jgi:hypothetical protein
MTNKPSPTLSAYLRTAALTLDLLARERSADGHQSDAYALAAGSQALAALERDVRAGRLLVGDDARDDHAERALDAAVRAAQ